MDDVFGNDTDGQYQSPKEANSRNGSLDQRAVTIK